jgi:DNA-binding XRE family transcriptional regulator
MIIYNRLIIDHYNQLMNSTDNNLTIIDYYTASDSRIMQELGKRLRALRLRKNITQEDLAERAVIAVGTIKSLEKGKGKLSSLIAVLRELDSLEQLENLIPPITLSPLQIAEANLKLPSVRVRATANKQKS